ncbi:MAG: acylneuraminate cytidylyltransferase family protein [Pseudomonadota bacterium]|nr:acylneuraminate cytidylyltransferase family protein [Pseudomonadota bacterium]
MRVLALILARGGSKRLPGKNIRTLGGKPLIVWSIDAARDIPEICDILVSTDDPAIAGVCREAGTLVPWLRPDEFATDTATSIDACLHALDWYESHKGKVDGLLLLQPTSPFRSRQTIITGITLFREHGGRPVVAFSPAESHPMWCFKIEGDCLRPFMDAGGLSMRSQDLPPAYVVNGALYLSTPSDLRAHGSFFSDDMLPLVINSRRQSLDIDTEWDWLLAESIHSRTATIDDESAAATAT